LGGAKAFDHRLEAVRLEYRQAEPPASTRLDCSLSTQPPHEIASNAMKPWPRSLALITKPARGKPGGGERLGKELLGEAIVTELAP